MASLHYEGNIRTMDGKFHIGLSLVEFEEDGVKIIYSPALDLSGYGMSFEEAKESFDEALKEFIRYTSNKRTFETVIRELGWVIAGSKKKPKYSPPQETDLITSNELYSELLNSKKSYRVSQENVEFAF